MIRIFFVIILLWGYFVSAQEIYTRNDTVWLFENYTVKEDYVLGIWPHDGRLENTDEVLKLKNKFGFTHIFLTLDKDSTILSLIIEAGYTTDRIMVHITPENYRKRIKEFGKIYAYYVDEPFERKLSLEGMREYINTYAAGSLFIISGYRRTSRLNELVSDSDGVMYSSYKHWWQCLPGVWCSWPPDYDQRPDWTDMQERYGEKSYSNWVGAHRDTTDYEELLEHASELGLNGIWLYQYQDPVNSEKNLLKLSEAAWAAGYMHKFERKYIREYQKINSEWIFVKDHSTEELRKIERFKDSKIKRLKD